MNKIHLVLQGKGGVGKSFVASLLGQFYAKNKRPVVCIDTDPVNATFAGYQSIGAERLKLMVGTVLDERNFDQLIERIIHAKSDFVIDNGASSFLPLSHYIAENSIVKLLDDNGYQVVFHSVVTGGQALGDTLAGLAGTLSLASAATPVVVWINEYFGDVRHEGTPFEEMDVYVENRDKIAALVRIPRQTSSTFGKDVQIMLEQKLTFDDVRLSEGFGIMAKQRLSMVEKALFGQMEEFGVA
jgi:hypothetical protein